MTSDTEPRSRRVDATGALREIASELLQLVEWHRVGDAPDSWIVPRLRLLLERSADLLKDAAEHGADPTVGRDARAARARIESHLRAVADIDSLELPDDLVASLLFRAATELIASNRRLLDSLRVTD